MQQDTNSQNREMSVIRDQCRDVTTVLADFRAHEWQSDYMDTNGQHLNGHHRDTVDHIFRRMLKSAGFGPQPGTSEEPTAE